MQRGRGERDGGTGSGDFVLGDVRMGLGVSKMELKFFRVVGLMGKVGCEEKGVGGK